MASDRAREVKGTLRATRARAVWLAAAVLSGALLSAAVMPAWSQTHTQSPPRPQKPPAKQAAKPAERPAKPSTGSAKPTAGLEIADVQPVGLDQPRVSLSLRRSTTGEPLSAEQAGETVNAVDAFLDTGASGIVLSAKSAEALKIRAEKDVTYEDVGVGGSSHFSVSEPLYASMEEDAAGKLVPMRAQLSRGETLLEAMVGGLDVAGMPLMSGRVVVITTEKVDKLEGRLGVKLLGQPGAGGVRAGTPKPARSGSGQQGSGQRPPRQESRPSPTAAAPLDVPDVAWHVRLTPTSYRRFTRLTPAGAPSPSLGDNPLVRNVVVTHNGKTTTGAFLLDTGAATSMISSKLAAELGVTYDPGDTGALADVPADKQFKLTIGGIGGQKDAAGFFAEQLALPTVEGRAIMYRPVPLLVKDISVSDPKTGETLTLDGILGMNLFVSSANVKLGALPDISNIRPSPFKTIVLDFRSHTLGLGGAGE